MSITEAQTALIAAGAKQVVIHEVHVCTPDEMRAPRYMVVAQFGHPGEFGAPYDLRSGMYRSLDDAVRRVNPAYEAVTA